jgi:uncharacterized protein YeaO (DUF488 family)
MNPMIKIKRVYDPFDVTDGLTILVDRLWPRGVRRSTQNIEMWMRDIAPSDQLRKRYMHDPAKWAIFKKRYIAELKKNHLVEAMVDIALVNDPVTFVFASGDVKRNNAVVLRKFIETKLHSVMRKSMRASKGS